MGLETQSEQLGMPPVFAPGHVFHGHFEIIRPLGRGGMALVFEVLDRITSRRVALKVIRPDRLTTPGIRHCLIQELLLARELRHHSIVAPYDIHEDGPYLFFTMELVEGVTLRELTRTRSPLPLQSVLAIMRPLCFALEHAHRIMVHRDVSPENVMVGTTGVKLIDFGIAKALKNSPASRFGQGKTFYCAPEQMADPENADIRADIYPLGIMFLELYVRRTLQKPLEKDVRIPGLSAECCRLLSRSVTPLARRFSSVREFREALEACGDGMFPQHDPRREEPEALYEFTYP